MSVRILWRSERGSILPLVIGFAVLAVALVVVTVGATSLYITQKRIDAVADSAALAGADGFTLTVVDGHPVAELNNADVWSAAEAVVNASAPGASLEDANTSDGVTVTVTVSIVWHPPIISPLIPNGLTLTAVGESRTALDGD